MSEDQESEQHELLPQPGNADGIFSEQVDLGKLRIGDLVLVRRVRGFDVGSPFVRLFQRWLNQLSIDHARWTHVAIYVGGGKLVEAKFQPLSGTLSGIWRGIVRAVTLGRVVPEETAAVDTAYLHKYYRDHALRFRRFRGANELNDVGLTLPLGPVRRLRIGIAALQYIGRPYGVGTILEFIGNRVSRSKDESRSLRDHFICSTLFQDCFIDATSSFPASGSDQKRMTPAFLSALGGFQNVRTKWVTAPHAEIQSPRLGWEHPDEHDEHFLSAALDTCRDEAASVLLEFLAVGSYEPGG